MSTSSRRISQAIRKNRPSRTSSSRARRYVAIPPPEGWPGGDPLKNGWRPGGRK